MPSDRTIIGQIRRDPSPETVSPLDRLEAENRHLRELLRSLTRDARYNESVMRRFQERELALLAAEDLPDLIQRLTIGLRGSFRLENVRLVLFDPHGVLDELLNALGVNSSNIPYLYMEKDVRAALRRYPDVERPWLGEWNVQHQPEPGPGPHPRSEALLPLRQPDGIAGFLHLGSRDPKRFHAGQGATFLERLARIAALCLENAVNRERLRLSGLTDGLTGLYNRRHLDARLREELIRAQRHGHTLGCLFIDADHFKRVNDEHGHAAGDQVLVVLAKRIREQLRGSDLPARYGGEEIAVLLPQTTPENACQLAERIRQRIAGEPVELNAGSSLRVTVSIGVGAVRPDRKSDIKQLAEHLLAVADRRVYAAKSAGRNRVCCKD